MSQIVPVAVPLTPAEPDSVTIPAETQIMYWCRLTPVVRSVDHSIGNCQSRRAAIIDSIFRHVDATLIVDGERIHLVHETVRPDATETKEVGFWNLESPLPPGTHTATLTLAYDPKQPTELESQLGTDVDESVAPRVALHPDSTPIELGSGREGTTQTTIRVVDTVRGEFQTTTDPFWDERTVYRPK